MKTTAEIASDLRNYANLITGGSASPAAPTPTGPTLVTGNADPNIAAQYIVNGKFARDFWVEGQVGAMQGADATEWNQANFNLHQAGDPNPEFSVTVVGPPASWNYNLKGAWDIGWLPPRAAVPTDPGWAAIHGGR